MNLSRLKSVFGSPLALGFYGAALFAVLLFLGMHAYRDHRAHHALMDLVRQQIQQQKATPK